jgi:hypothetical protein
MHTDTKTFSANDVAVAHPQPALLLTANGVGRTCRPQRCGERVKQIAREIGVTPARLSDGTLVFGPAETARVVAEVARREMEARR